jgi:hypothetical protein
LFTKITIIAKYIKLILIYVVDLPRDVLENLERILDQMEEEERGNEAEAIIIEEEVVRNDEAQIDNLIENHIRQIEEEEEAEEEEREEVRGEEGEEVRDIEREEIVDEGEEEIIDGDIDNEVNNDDNIAENEVVGQIEEEEEVVRGIEREEIEEEVRDIEREVIGAEEQEEIIDVELEEEEEEENIIENDDERVEEQIANNINDDNEHEEQENGIEIEDEMIMDLMRDVPLIEERANDAENEEGQIGLLIEAEDDEIAFIGEIGAREDNQERAQRDNQEGVQRVGTRRDNREPEDVVFTDICSENVLRGVAGETRMADRFLAIHMRILCKYNSFFYLNYNKFLLLIIL